MRLAAVISLVLFGFCLLPLHERARSLPATPSSPFDDYGNICWEDESARLDNFAIALQNQPTATGHIMVYAGRLSCPDEAKSRGNRAKSWLVQRGVPPRQIVVRNGGFQKEVRTMLVVYPKGADDYDYPTSLPKDEVSIRKRCVDKVFARILCLKR